MGGYHHHLFNSAFADQASVSMLRILHQDRYPATYKVEWQFIAFNEARFCR
ncbi:hypothetical protein LTSEURB_5676, partial [Salmonella enterica subsp. enterica serovar Urbana str. R8-2977]